MEDRYLKSLKEEYSDLCDKYYRLEKFVDRVILGEIDSKDLKCPEFMLTKQLEIMREYKDVLNRRITYRNVDLELSNCLNKEKEE